MQGMSISRATLCASATNVKCSASRRVITASGGPTPILDDAVTYSYLTNLSHLTISALDVGVLIQHPRISDLTLTLIAPDGTRVLTACADNVVRYWDADEAQVLKSFSYASAPTTEVAFSPDGHRGLTTTSDHRLHLWDLATGDEIHAPGQKEGAFLDLSATTL